MPKEQFGFGGTLVEEELPPGFGGIPIEKPEKKKLDGFGGIPIPEIEEEKEPTAETTVTAKTPFEVALPSTLEIPPQEVVPITPKAKPIPIIEKPLSVKDLQGATEEGRIAVMRQKVEGGRELNRFEEEKIREDREKEWFQSQPTWKRRERIMDVFVGDFLSQMTFRVTDKIIPMDEEMRKILPGTAALGEIFGFGAAIGITGRFKVPGLGRIRVGPKNLGINLLNNQYTRKKLGAWAARSDLPELVKLPVVKRTARELLARSYKLGATFGSKGAIDRFVEDLPHIKPLNIVKSFAFHFAMGAPFGPLEFVAPIPFRLAVQFFRKRGWKPVTRIYSPTEAKIELQFSSDPRAKNKFSGKVQKLLEESVKTGRDTEVTIGYAPPGWGGELANLKPTRFETPDPILKLRRQSAEKMDFYRRLQTERKSELFKQIRDQIERKEAVSATPQMEKLLNEMEMLQKNIPRLEAESRRFSMMGPKPEVPGTLEDPLMGILNRAGGQRLMRAHTQSNTPVTIASLDLDSFKVLNDKYGAKIGDQILRDFADVAKNVFKDLGELVRQGGDEILIYGNPGVSKEALLKGLDQFQKIVKTKRFSSKRLKVTFTTSAERFDDFTPIGEETLEDVEIRLLDRLDRAVKEGKKTERGRIVDIEEPITARPSEKPLEAPGEAIPAEPIPKPLPVKPVVPTKKPIWKMTLEEFKERNVKLYKKKIGSGYQTKLEDDYIFDVKKAIERGEKISPEVQKSFEAMQSRIQKQVKEVMQLDRLASETEKPSVELGDKTDLISKGGKTVSGFEPPHPFWRRKVNKMSGEEIVRRNEIIRELEEKFSVPILTGRFRQKALGIFKKDPRVIRTALADDIETTSHELGHVLIGDLFGGIENASKQFKPFEKELLKIATKPKAGGSSLEEGFSEFLRFYISDEGKARTVTPKFYRWFDDFMRAENADVRDVLLKTRRDFDRWVTAPPVAHIRSSIADTEKKLAKPSTLKNLYEDFIDDLAFLNQAVTEMTKGKEIAFSENPYILKRLMRGEGGKVESFFKFGAADWKTLNSTTKPLDNILKPMEKNLEDLDAYLIARRVPELKARGVETGVDLTKAKEATRILENQYPEIKKIAREIDEFQDAVLRYYRDSGGMTQEAYKKIKEANKFYTPFFRIMEEDVISPQGTKAGFTSAFSPVKRIKGSTRPILPPLESIIKNTYSLVTQADRQEVARSLIRLAEKTKGMGRMIEELPAPIVKVTDIQTKEIISKLNIDDPLLSEALKKIPNEIIPLFKPSYFKLGSQEITVPFEGKWRVFRINDPKLYETMTGLDRETSNWLVRALSFPAKALRMGATVWSPEFSIRNPLRDQIGAFIWSKHGYKPGFDLTRGIFHILKKDEALRTFKVGGGERSMLVSMDRNYLQQNLREMLQSGTKKGMIKTFVTSPFEALRIASEFGEKGTRVGETARAIKRLRDAGFTGKELKMRAAFAGREVTLDFARQGTKGRVINQLVAFWNANMQGIDKTVRAFKEDPVGTNMRAIAGVSLPSMALHLLNIQDPRFRELPAWQRHMFWIVIPDRMDTKTWKSMTSEQKAIHMEDWGNRLYRIPKPFAPLSIYAMAPEMMIDWMNDNDPKFKEQAGSLLRDMSPGFVPTFALPILENFANKSVFLKRPIVPESQEDLEAQFQTGGFSSETAKMIGRALNYSPAKIDNLILGYSGGAGKLGTEIVDEIIETMGAVELPPEPLKTPADFPLLRGFSVRFPSMSATSIREFYDHYNKAIKANKTFSFLLKNDTKKAVKHYEKNEKLIEMSAGYREYGERFRDINAEVKRIRDNRKMNSETKRRKIDTLSFQMIDLAQMANQYLWKQFEK